MLVMCWLVIVVLVGDNSNGVLVGDGGMVVRCWL